VLLAGLFTIYKYVTRRRSKKYKNVVGIVLLVVFVILAGASIGALVVISRDDKGDGTTATPTQPPPPPTTPTKGYKQKVGGICDDLESLDEQRAAAESKLDATGLVTAWKDYIGEEIAFSDLSPPVTQQELHEEVGGLWRRHAAVLRKLTHEVNDDRSADAMKKLLDGPTGRQDDRLRREVGDKLVDLAGSACKYEPSPD
jgi:hypothetical protein